MGVFSSEWSQLGAALVHQLQGCSRKLAEGVGESVGWVRVVRTAA
ncbi:MAG: hypothetical protein ACI91B_003945 [Planctomycetota bacterium]